MFHVFFENFGVFLAALWFVFSVWGSLGVGHTVNFELLRALLSIAGAGIVPSHGQWLSQKFHEERLNSYCFYCSCYVVMVLVVVIVLVIVLLLVWFLLLFLLVVVAVVVVLVVIDVLLLSECRSFIERSERRLEKIDVERAAELVPVSKPKPQCCHQTSFDNLQWMSPWSWKN